MLRKKPSEPVRKGSIYIYIKSARGLVAFKRNKCILFCFRWWLGEAAIEYLAKSSYLHCL